MRNATNCLQMCCCMKIDIMYSLNANAQTDNNQHQTQRSAASVPLAMNEVCSFCRTNNRRPTVSSWVIKSRRNKNFAIFRQRRLWVLKVTIYFAPEFPPKYGFSPKFGIFRRNLFDETRRFSDNFLTAKNWERERGQFSRPATMVPLTMDVEPTLIGRCVHVTDDVKFHQFISKSLVCTLLLSDVVSGLSIRI